MTVSRLLPVHTIPSCLARSDPEVYALFGQAVRQGDPSGGLNVIYVHNNIRYDGCVLFGAEVRNSVEWRSIGILVRTCSGTRIGEPNRLAQNSSIGHCPVLVGGPHLHNFLLNLFPVLSHTVHHEVTDLSSTMAAHLSPAKCILLTVHYASQANIKALPVSYTHLTLPTKRIV